MTLQKAPVALVSANVGRTDSSDVALKLIRCGKTLPDHFALTLVKPVTTLEKTASNDLRVLLMVSMSNMSFPESATLQPSLQPCSRSTTTWWANRNEH